MTYTYVNGTWLLHVEPAVGGGVFFVIDNQDGDSESLSVPAAEVDRLVCGVLAAAGRDTIILDQPDEGDLPPGAVANALGGVDVGTDLGLTPAGARALAWDLAKAADRAESEPDADEVRKLADVIEDGGTRTSSEIARDLLRRFELRERS